MKKEIDIDESDSGDGYILGSNATKQGCWRFLADGCGERMGDLPGFLPKLSRNWFVSRPADHDLIYEGDLADFQDISRRASPRIWHSPDVRPLEVISKQELLVNLLFKSCAAMGAVSISGLRSRPLIGLFVSLPVCGPSDRRRPDIP
jgi:hypothetical protein